MNLYHLQAEIQNILARVGEEGEVPSDELLQEIDRLNKEAPDRVDTLYKVIRTATACSTTIRNEMSYLSNKARRWESIKDSAKEHLFKLLEVLGVRNFQTDLCRPTICKGPPVVAVREGFNLSSLEGSEFEYLINKEITLSAERVKAAAKAGKELPDGVEVRVGVDYLRVL